MDNQINNYEENEINQIGFEQLNINMDNSQNKIIRNETTLESVANNNRMFFQNNKDPKKIIILIDSSNRYYNIYVPIYLSKEELYKSVTPIITNGVHKIVALISNNNYVIDCDDTSIDDIEEGANLNILYEGESYEHYLNKIYEPDYKINISVTGNKTLLLSLPPQISVSQMIKAILIKYDLFPNEDNQKLCSVIYNGKKLDFNEQKKLNSIFGDMAQVTLIQYGNVIGGPFLYINITAIIYDRKNNDVKEINCNKYAPMKELFDTIKEIFKFEIKKVFFEKNEIDKNTTKSWASINVRDKILCEIESDTIHMHIINKFDYAE